MNDHARSVRPAIHPAWADDAEAAMQWLGIGSAEMVVFRRGGEDHVGRVVRHGRTVVDVTVTVDGQELVMRVRADLTYELPACGHHPTVTGCGGCDPGAVELEIDDAVLPLLKAS